MFGLSSLKLIAIGIALVVFVGLPAWGAWKLGAYQVAESERTRAEKEISEFKESYARILQTQIELTDQYRDLSDNQMTKFLDKLDNIKVTNTTITRNITTERASNPEFYNQPLPAGGREQWEAARKQFQ